MSESEVSKTYVRPDNTAVLNCPYCGRQKVTPVDSFRGYKHKLKVKCSCSKKFMVILEFRKRVRKKTYLRGTYTNHSQNNSSGNLVIRDISVGGLQFTSLDAQNLRVDDELTVEFALDDEHRTEINKEVTVRDIRKNSVGCEFERSDEFAFDGPLGNYVMS
jgi:hypothetical protein